MFLYIIISTIITKDFSFFYTLDFWFSIYIFITKFKGYGRIELQIYDLQSKCRPSATYPFYYLYIYIYICAHKKKIKNLNNKQIYIVLIILHQQNVNIIYQIQNQDDDSQLNDKLKHVIILFLKIMFLQ